MFCHIHNILSHTAALLRECLATVAALAARPATHHQALDIALHLLTTGVQACVLAVRRESQAPDAIATVHFTEDGDNNTVYLALCGLGDLIQACASLSLPENVLDVVLPLVGSGDSTLSLKVCKLCSSS